MFTFAHENSHKLLITTWSVEEEKKNQYLRLHFLFQFPNDNDDDYGNDAVIHREQLNSPESPDGVSCLFLIVNVCCSHWKLMMTFVFFYFFASVGGFFPVKISKIMTIWFFSPMERKLLRHVLMNYPREYKMWERNKKFLLPNMIMWSSLVEKSKKASKQYKIWFSILSRFLPLLLFILLTTTIFFLPFFYMMLLFCFVFFVLYGMINISVCLFVSTFLYSGIYRSQQQQKWQFDEWWFVWKSSSSSSSSTSILLRMACFETLM